MSSDAATILIADDDPLIRSAYKAALERHGYKVALAEDGVGALAVVEKHPVDCVLLDILMPRKEGLETLIDLKRRFPGVRVFAMSGGSAGKADFLSIAEKFGADGVLRKPFRPQVLLDMLAACSAAPRKQHSQA